MLAISALKGGSVINELLFSGIRDIPAQLVVEYRTEGHIFYKKIEEPLS